VTAPRTVLLIPAFNEAPRLPAVLAKIAALDSAALRADLEVVVIDDGSRDGTAQIARAAGATVLRHPFNLGYGAALQTGYKYAVEAGADFAVQIDADGQHDPAHVPAVLAPLVAGEADLVVGSRFASPGSYRMGPLKSLGRALFRCLAGWAGLEVTDPTSGFQAIDRAVLELYVRDSFPTDFPDVDVLLLVHRAGFRVRERSVEMSEGSRASTLHGGLRPLYYVYRMLLSLLAVSGEPPGPPVPAREANAAAPRADEPEAERGRGAPGDSGEAAPRS